MNHEFVEKLKALGLEVVKPTEVQPPPDLLIGVEETKDVVILLCDFASKAINKESLVSVTLGKNLLDAFVGANKIPSEIRAITEQGTEELRQTAVDNLNFVADKKKLEALAEAIVMGALIIMLGIVNFARN